MDRIHRIVYKYISQVQHNMHIPKLTEDQIIEHMYNGLINKEYKVYIFEKITAEVHYLNRGAMTGIPVGWDTFSDTLWKAISVVYHDYGLKKL